MYDLMQLSFSPIYMIMLKLIYDIMNTKKEKVSQKAYKCNKNSKKVEKKGKCWVGQKRASV